MSRHESANMKPAGRRMMVADDEFAAVSEGRIRIRIGVVLFLAMLTLVILRLAEVSLLTPKDERNAFPRVITVERADILDRHGEVLATTLQTYSLYAEPRRIWNIDETAADLLSVRPNLDRGELLERLSSDRAFVWIERGLSPKERQAVFALGRPGLNFRMEPKRVYPRGNLASHVVGFTNVDMDGTGGSEQAFNDRLSEPNAPATVLSLDMRVQYALAEELDAARLKFKAKSNAGLVLDIKTGEIIAMASLPNFDPNQPTATSPETRYNHASMSTYDLGSVFKPITMALALETGVTDLKEKLPVQNRLLVRNKYITDDHPSPVPMAMPEILAESSNRGTAILALRSGGEAQQAFLEKLGLFDRAPIELAETARPQVQTEWQDITTVTVSYGHGISVTPLALASALGALLNGGNYIKPTVLKRDASNPAQETRVMSEINSQHMRDLMRYTVTDGTGRNSDVTGYGVMGKTGTADKPSIDGYDEARLVTSFVGAFPYEDPTYLVFITFDEPQAIEGTYGYATAGWNAAPTTGKVIERIAPMLGVRRQLSPIAMSPFSNEGALP